MRNSSLLTLSLRALFVVGLLSFNAATAHARTPEWGICQSGPLIPGPGLWCACYFGLGNECNNDPMDWEHDCYNILSGCAQ